MDLVEIKDDYLRNCTNWIGFDNWFIYDWPEHLITYYENSSNYPRTFTITEMNVPFKRTCFTIDDDHIELYDGVFVQEPHTAIDPIVGGRLMTLVMHAKFTVKNAKVKGKMCIRHPKKSRLFTEFELELKSAEMIQTVGFIIAGDGLVHNLCLYEFPKVDVSLTHRCDSEIVSILDRETDSFRRKLLEVYLVEILTKDLRPLVKKHEIIQLSIKQTVSELCGNCYLSRDQLRTHNRISHAAMKNIANHIINLTNDLLEKTSRKLRLSRIYGLDSEKNLKVYKAYISTLHTIAFEQHSEYHAQEVIISNQDDCVILYVPVKFWEIGLHYKEVQEDSADSDDEFKNKQIFTTEEAHFKFSLKRIEEDYVEFKLLRFKITYIMPIGDHPIDMAVDHVVSFTIEEYVKSMMERALKDKKLQELAIKPNVHVEDDGDNLYDSDEFNHESD